MPHGFPESLDPGLIERALEATRDGITIADARRSDVPLVYVNPGFERLTGFAAQDVLGTNCRFLQHDQADATVRATLANAVANGIPCLATLRNYRKDGSAFWNELSISPIRSTAGELTHFIGIQKDVTARVEATRRLGAEKNRLEIVSADLEHFASRDPLTELFNRRYFQGSLETEWRRAQRDSKALGCVMIDVDHFKSYNDQYGHGAGDACLKQVATALGNTFKRAGDLVARYGGEEFVALAIDVDLDQALARGERFRKAVQDLQLPHAASQNGDVVTVSVGVASVVPSDAFTPSALVDAADSALYNAKSLGRNQVARGLTSTQGF